MRGLIAHPHEVEGFLKRELQFIRRPVKWPLYSKWDAGKRRIFTEEYVADVCEYVKERRRHSHQRVISPFGTVGQKLYVRETWASVGDCDHFNHLHGTKTVLYRADGVDCVNKWRPSIHMPLWASRLTLEVTSLEVERLRNVSDEEALASGIVETQDMFVIEGNILGGKCVLKSSGGTARTAYWHRWNSLYAKKGFPFDSDPWTWKVGVKVVDNG